MDARHPGEGEGNRTVETAAGATSRRCSRAHTAAVGGDEVRLTMGKFEMTKVGRPPFFESRTGGQEYRLSKGDSVQTLDYPPVKFLEGYPSRIQPIPTTLDPNPIDQEILSLDRPPEQLAFVAGGHRCHRYRIQALCQQRYCTSVDRTVKYREASRCSLFSGSGDITTTTQRFGIESRTEYRLCLNNFVCYVEIA